MLEFKGKIVSAQKLFEHCSVIYYSHALFTMLNLKAWKSNYYAI